MTFNQFTQPREFKAGESISVEEWTRHIKTNMAALAYPMMVVDTDTETAVPTSATTDYLSSSTTWENVKQLSIPSNSLPESGCDLLVTLSGGLGILGPAAGTWGAITFSLDSGTKVGGSTYGMGIEHANNSAGSQLYRPIMYQYLFRDVPHNTATVDLWFRVPASTTMAAYGVIQFSALEVS